MQAADLFEQKVKPSEAAGQPRVSPKSAVAQPTTRRLPWTRVRSSDPGPLAHAVAAVLRLFVGAVVAGAVGHDRPAVTAWLALGVGAAAPVALEKLTVLIPLVLRGTAQHVLSSVLAADDGASALPLDGTDAETGVDVIQNGPGPEGS